jgi:hypothetical protein
MERYSVSGMNQPPTCTVDLRVNYTERQLQRIPAARHSVRATQQFLCPRSSYLMPDSIGGLPKGVNDVRKRPTNAIHRWKTLTEEEYWSRSLRYGHWARIDFGYRRCAERRGGGRGVHMPRCTCGNPMFRSLAKRKRSPNHNSRLPGSHLKRRSFLGLTMSYKRKQWAKSG